jgi:hypothetical protein
VVSSEIERWLGNQPSRIAKLKKAVSESSTSVIPRYLLGRAYRNEGSPEKALEVLEPVIRKRFDEFRSFVEYVRAMLALGQSYSKCIAVLSQSRLDGVTIRVTWHCSVAYCSWTGRPTMRLRYSKSP